MLKGPKGRELDTEISYPLQESLRSPLIFYGTQRNFPLATKKRRSESIYCSDFLNYRIIFASLPRNTESDLKLCQKAPTSIQNQCNKCLQRSPAKNLNQRIEQQDPGLTLTSLHLNITTQVKRKNHLEKKISTPTVIVQVLATCQGYQLICFLQVKEALTHLQKLTHLHEELTTPHTIHAFTQNKKIPACRIMNQTKKGEQTPDYRQI